MRSFPSFFPVSPEWFPNLPFKTNNQYTPSMRKFDPRPLKMRSFPSIFSHFSVFIKMNPQIFRRIAVLGVYTNSKTSTYPR